MNSLPRRGVDPLLPSFGKERERVRWARWRDDPIAGSIDRAISDGAEVAVAIIATINAAHGCRTTVTFDRDAARRLPQMELLA